MHCLHIASKMADAQQAQAFKYRRVFSLNTYEQSNSRSYLHVGTTDV